MCRLFKVALVDKYDSYLASFGERGTRACMRM